MMNCPGPVLLASVLWMVLIATCSVKSFPVADKGGGYPDSIQSLGYGAPYGAPSAGGGSGYGNEPANYDFEYEVFGGGNFFGHQESRRDKNTNGKYHVLLPDGRRQIVTCIADETGYHPTITYEDASSTGGGEGGYPASSTPDSGYGAPVGDNSLNNRFSSRIKRQHLTDQEDVVQFYNPENKPDQRFRNTQRHRRFTPQKGYLIVYPTSPKVSAESKASQITS